MILRSVTPDLYKDPWDDYGHFLAEYCKFTHSRIMVELGVGWGPTTVKLAQIAKIHNGKLFAYDYFEASCGSAYPNDPKSKKEVIENKLREAGIEDKYFCIVKKSSRDNDFQDMVRIHTGGKIDFIFIDADHSYSGVRNDFLKLYPLLAPDGTMALHDTFNHAGCRQFLLDLRGELNDGTFDLVPLPWGHGTARCGLTLLVKRIHPITHNDPSCLANGPSVPFDPTDETIVMQMGEIFAKEREWYEKETGKKYRKEEIGLDGNGVMRYKYHWDH